jgi:N-acetylneuraminic acid mutarotase
MDEKASMILPRSNYGATINAHTNEIYVAGGNTTGGLMTQRCEAYDIDTNEWRELPPLNEEKVSASLSVLAGRWLYCMGGYAKDSSGGCALSTIEVLDL